MATHGFTNARRPQSIKAVLVAVAVTVGGLTILASAAGLGQLPTVFGFVGGALLVQAGFYATL